MKKIISIALGIMLLLTACAVSEEQESEIEIDEANKPEKLVIYASGISHSFNLSDEQEVIEFTRYCGLHPAG